MKRFASAILMVISSFGCATSAGRFAISAVIGGGAGAAGGAALSPNEESRALNAILFGLTGALAGGVIGILTEKDKTTLPKVQSLRTQFEISNSKSLPQFVQERLTPVVVEEYHESDSVSEDGSLHEPHKVYRIKRPAELISKPISIPAEKKEHHDSTDDQSTN